MKAITYRIRLLEPALVTELSGDPNSAVAFDYLPGSVLRGAFIRRYLQQHPEIDLGTNDVARRFFLNGETRWLNAYPLDRLNTRCLPTPRSLHKAKNGNENDVFDLAVNEPASKDEYKPQWIKAGSSFCRFDADTIRLIEPNRQISVHTARTRRFGRARSEKLDDAKGDTRGAVYRYDALAAGQIFEAVVLCDDADVDVDEIKKLLTGRVTVGKSQTGGYGGAVIENVSEPDGNWKEYPLPDFLKQPPTGATNYQGKLIITLLSDVLFRDTDTGQYVVEAEETRRLLDDKLGGPLNLSRAFLGLSVVCGFNRKWGLPLPQTQAFAAGSVFVFDEVNVSLQGLVELFEKGIGERRAEGFGRIAINWQAKSELTVDAEKSRYEVNDLAFTAESGEAKLAERVAGRILRRRLDQRVTAEGLKRRIDKPPHKSQIARLRGIIQEELMKPQPSVERVEGFIKGLKERNITRRQFSQARVSNTPLNEWLLEQLAGKDDAKWRGLPGFKVSEQPQVSIGGISAQPTKQMRDEYLLRYLDAFLARAAKQIGTEGAQ